MNNKSIEPNPLLQGIAVKKAIVAFDPVQKHWLTSKQADESTPAMLIPNLDGQLISDSLFLAAVANDFGHIVRQTPLAVLQPGSPRDIAKIIRYANRIGVTVAMRGQEHSSYS